MSGSGDTSVSSWLLKVLNGTHVGAQIALPLAGITVGRSDACDVYLNDPHVVDHHCKLRPLPDGVQVEVGDGVVYLAGEKISTPTATAKAYQVITLGSTHIACGPTASVWPAITFPKISAVEGASEKKASASAQPIKPESRWRLVLAGGLLSLIALGAILFWASQGDATTEPFKIPSKTFESYSQSQTPTNQARVVEAISAKLHHALPGAVVRHWELLGRPAVTVYVRGPEQAQAARDVIDDFPKFTVANIVDLDVLEQSIDEFLGQQHFPVHVTIEQDGSATWTGYLPGREAWTRLLEAVNQDLPSLEQNTCKIFFGTDLRDDLEKSLLAAGLSKLIKVEPGRSELTFSGTLTAPQDGTWAKIKSDLITRTGTLLPIKDTITVQTIDHTSPLVLSSPVVSVQSIGIPWVALADGQVIFAGGELAKGYILESIQNDHLNVRGPEGELSVPLDELVNSK